MTGRTQTFLKVALLPLFCLIAILSAQAASAAAPTVVTGAVPGAPFTAATLNGSAPSAGTSPIFSRGFEYGLTDSYGEVSVEDLLSLPRYDYSAQWGRNPVSNGQFNEPTGIATDASGNIYVTDMGNSRIQKFNSSGSFITKWGSSGSGDGQFYNPHSIAIDAQGDVYVADTNNHRIQKFDSNGNYITKWGGHGANDGQFQYPFGITIDHSGTVYVIDTYNYRIQKFDTSGNYLAKWGSEGGGDGQLSMPLAIAIDSSNNVYVVDNNNSRIQKFNSNGGYITKWGSNGNSHGQFYNPYGIAIDSVDTIYVADSFNHRIQKFDTSGNYLDEWGGYGIGNGQLNRPPGIAADHLNNIYVADAGNNRIQKFNSAGAYLVQWGWMRSIDGQFDGPAGVTTDSTGNVYVADTYNSRIQKFSSTGSFITKWGSGGSGDGQFSNPQGITVDSTGNVYVADSFNHRIQKFSSTGSFITKWGSNGSGDGQFSQPQSITTDSTGNVYVADTYNSRIQKFSSTGSFITKWGSGGSGDGQFNNPTGITTDSTGNVYVADSYNSRIQKFSGTGSFITKWGSNGSGDSQFSYPAGITTDSTGNVYVADYASSRIQKFSSTGTFITKWGSYGPGDGQFNSPAGITTDSTGNVYVADTYNHRIQKFSTNFYTGDFSANLSGLSCDSTYYYRAYAINNEGMGYGNDASFTTGVCKPEPPTDIIATVGSNTSIHLTWSPPAQTGTSPIGTYYISYSPVGSDDWHDQNTYGPDTSYELNELRPGTQYRIRIKAVNQDNYEGDDSEEVTGTTGTPGLHLISDCQGLQDIQNNLEDSYELAHDIDCSDSVNWNGGLGFQPIGNIMEGRYFSGVFAGNGYTIRSLYIGGSAEHIPMGLFDTAYNAVIKDFTLDHLTVRQELSPEGIAYFGSVAGYSYQSTLSNVHAHYIDAYGPWLFSGGLLGYADGASDISKSSAVGSITDHFADPDIFNDSEFSIVYAGGISSTAGGLSIVDSYADITFSSQQLEYYYGGIVSYIFSDGAATLDSSYGSGSVTDSPQAGHIGGMAGIIDLDHYRAKKPTITDSFLSLSSSTTTATKGGIAAMVAISEGRDANSVTDITNVYHDADRLNTANCDPAQVITDCHPISGQPNYFYNNHTNAPMNTWDFTNIWQTTNTLPTFKRSLVMSITAITPERLAIIRAREAAKLTLGNKVGEPSPSATPTPTPARFAAGVNSPSGDNPTPPKGLIDRVTQAAVEFVRNLPEGTIRSFPYVLFGVILLAAITMLYEVKRQTDRLKSIKALIVDQRSLAQQRDTFWHIAANYLRAPVTLLISGAELLELQGKPITQTIKLHAASSAKPTRSTSAKPPNKAPTKVTGTPVKSAPRSSQLAKLIARLQTNVNAIMSSIEQSETLRDIEWPSDKAPASVLLSPRFWLPVSFATGLILLANYIAIGFRKFEVSNITLLTQTVVFGLVVYVLYWVLTRLGMIKSRVASAESMLESQTKALQDARHELVGQTVQSLEADIVSLKAEIQKISSKNLARKPLSEGIERLAEIIGSFELLNAAETGYIDMISPPGSQVRLNGLLKDILGTEQPELVRKNLTIQSTLDDSDLQIPGSTRLNQQILMSVLNNAVEFSPQKSHISLASIQKPGMKGVSVADRGPGVSHEQLSHMLEPFTKADGQDALKLDHGGLGINLYVTKMLLERLGGEISINSNLGQGTMVSLYWPV